MWVEMGHATSRSNSTSYSCKFVICGETCGVDLRRTARSHSKTWTSKLAAPVIASAIPRRSKGSPLMHDVLPPVCALSVQAVCNVWEAVITQRPTATMPTDNVNVTALFITPFLPSECSQIVAIVVIASSHVIRRWILRQAFESRQQRRPCCRVSDLREWARRDGSTPTRISGRVQCSMSRCAASRRWVPNTSRCRP